MFYLEKIFQADQSFLEQLHIKIQKDLQGLVGSMTNMFKGQSKTGLPGLPKLPPLPTLPQALKVKEGGSRPFALNLPTFPQGGLKVPTLPQAPGKPPVSDSFLGMHWGRIWDTFWKT